MAPLLSGFPGPSRTLPFRDARSVSPLRQFFFHLQIFQLNQPTSKWCLRIFPGPAVESLPDLTLRLSDLCVHPLQSGAQAFCTFILILFS
jgi:hypothetical protein